MKNNWSIPGIEKGTSSDDLVDEKLMEAEIVILLQGNNMFGNRVYSYVKLMGKTLKELFIKLQKGENFKPSDFGTVIAAGTGEPPKEIQEEMQALYNMTDVPMPKPISFTSFQPKFFNEE